MKLVIFLFLIDFVVCVNNSNNEYDLAFSGFTEEFFEISLTHQGKKKILNYFNFLIYNNLYYYDELRSDYFYTIEIDFFYKNYSDTYK